MKKVFFTMVLAIVSSVWMMSEASWCMSVAKAGSAQNIRIGGTFQAESMPCEDDTLPCPACLTIALQSGGIHYLVSNDPQIVAILDTVPIGSFAIIEGNHYLEGHVDFINVTNIIFPQTDIQQLSGEWEISRETVSTPTGDGGTRWFSTHDVNYTNYVLADDLIYKVILDQSSGYAHYSDAVPYMVDRKEDGTWLLTAEGLFSSSAPVDEGIASPVTIFRLTEDEMEWMYAANGGDEGPNYYYQYLKRHTQKEEKLPSLCDEWNVLAMRNPNTSAQLLRFSHYYLTTDTMINGLHCVQVQLNDQYKGALREDDNANIYYVPADSTHEYLLYAFHAQVGDELENLWVSYTNLNKDAVSDLKVTISEIKPTTPKTIVVDVSFTLTSGEVREHFNRQFEWLDGIGNVGGPFFANLLNGPINSDSNGDLRGVALLCAYKNGEHVYTSEWGEKYGCEYNYDPYSTPTDTIPLYIKDGPGTSTVEPVDPNQIVATLVGDMLSIYEYIGAEIGYKVSKASPGNNMPARGKEMADDTFSESVSIQLKERGLYTLELTNPEWGYTIVGTFEYGGMQGIEPAETVVPAAQKILRNGQLLIQKGDRIYTVQGIEIRE